jgi:hypothetical protein
MIRLGGKGRDRVHDVLPSAVPRLVHNSTILGSLFRAAHSRALGDYGGLGRPTRLLSSCSIASSAGPPKDSRSVLAARRLLGIKFFMIVRGGFFLAGALTCDLPGSSTWTKGSNSAVLPTQLSLTREVDCTVNKESQALPSYVF